MIDYKKIKKVAYSLGIKLTYITIYKAELIHLKNDGKTYKEIAELLDTKLSTVSHWFDKESQPKSNFIFELEKLYFKRISIIKV